MKKFRFLSLLVVLAMILSACGGGAAPAADGFAPPLQCFPMAFYPQLRS